MQLNQLHSKISLPHCIKKLSPNFSLPHWHTQHSSHKHVLIKYGQQIQHALIDNLSPLNNKEIFHIQDIIGVFLYYACAGNPTLAVTLSAIALHQAKETTTVLQAHHQLLNSVATHPHATSW